MPLLPEVIVLSQHEAVRFLQNDARRRQLAGVVSIGEEDESIPFVFSKIAPKRFLRLEFDDVEEDRPAYRFRAPSLRDARRLVAFGAGMPTGSLLVHCAAGVSRSSAAALVLLAQRLGVGREKEAVLMLKGCILQAQAMKLRHGDFIRPNRRLVAAGDEALGMNGVLLRACQTLLSSVYADDPDFHYSG